jgi:RNA polymerase sigma factor (sigma-70 family)
VPNPETGVPSFGTPQTADECLRQAAPVISKIVRRQLSDGHRRFSVNDANDLNQEILLKLILNLSAFDRTKPLEPWVARVAVNVCRDCKRRSRLRYTVDIEPTGMCDAHREAEPFESIDARQELTVLWQYIRNSDRVLVQLRFWENLTFEEIAEATDRTPASVNMQLSRLINKLRRLAK